jgi:hypothetical protein
MSINGFPGKRVEPKREGMTPKTFMLDEGMELFSGVYITFVFINHGRPSI